MFRDSTGTTALGRSLIGLGVLLLLVGAFVAPVQTASAAIVPPANRCDGNVCVDCAFDTNINKCAGACNTPANAVCNTCKCDKYIDPANPNLQQCYCMKPKPAPGPGGTEN